MELKDFVRESLEQIIEAVSEVQAKAPHGARINPRSIMGNPPVLRESEHGSLIQQIDFDVAVTAQEGTQTKGGIAVFAGWIGAGSHGQSTSTSQQVSRIKFCVPVLLPTK